MLIYILAAMLLCILVIAYVGSGQDLLAPCVIAAASFFACTMLALLNLDYWQYGFHPASCLVITASLLAFGSGAMLVEWRLGKLPPKCRLVPSQPIVLPPWLPFLAAAGALFLAAVSFQGLYEISLAYGNMDGYAGMFKTVRRLMEERVIGLPRWQSYRLVVAYGTAVFFLTVYMYNLIWFGFKKRDLACLLPIFSFFPHIVLTTGRVDFLKIVLAAVMVAGVFFQMKHGCSFRNNIKIVGCMGVAAIFFFTAFFLSGSLTWKGVSAERGPLTIISHYAGAQIPAFDVFLNNNYYPENELIGQMTLVRIYSNLRALGMDLPQTSPILEYTYFQNVDTNVYTPLRFYIQDYGYVGMVMVSFLLGLLCTVLYGMIKRRRIGFYGVMAYAVLCWQTFLFGQGENFFLTVANTSAVYLLAVLYLWYLLMKRYNKSNPL